VRQVLSVNEDKAILVGGVLANRNGSVKPGMYHVLYSDGTEKFTNNPEAV
jgi:hypothetical protein